MLANSCRRIDTAMNKEGQDTVISSGIGGLCRACGAVCEGSDVSVNSRPVCLGLSWRSVRWGLLANYHGRRDVMVLWKQWTGGTRRDRVRKMRRGKASDFRQRFISFRMPGGEAVGWKFACGWWLCCKPHDGVALGTVCSNSCASLLRWSTAADS